MANKNVKTRVEIQQLLDYNTIRAGGDFHYDDFNKESFLHELNKSFKLTPKEKTSESSELLEKIIKLSTTKVRGRFNAKELKHSKFLSNLLENFEIEKL
jgi:hypothetical protein